MHAQEQSYVISILSQPHNVYGNELIAQLA